MNSADLAVGILTVTITVRIGSTGMMPSMERDKATQMQASWMVAFKGIT